MKIQKVRKVKTPTRGTDLSAGLDFYVPEDLELSTLFIDLGPGDSCNIPSGIKADVPEGYALVAFNKSGVALKKGLQVGACVVDEDYQGEIHLHLTNTSTLMTSIAPGEKIVQFLLLPVSYAAVEVVEDELFSKSTERGSGAFDSTGTT